MPTLHFFTVVVVLLVLTALVVNASDPILKIKNGKLRGTKLKTAVSSRTILAFQGIPYAKPPIGELRFEEPEPAEGWDNIRDARTLGEPCIQRDFIYDLDPPLIGSEDCLFVNVYTTRLEPEEPMPVIFFIHGGGWQSGQGGHYGPQYLLEHDVILVTFNYRLGPLGFLSTEDEECPGNFGLKDQVLALRWVQENIAKFGGDPNRVTISGQSAGGASVHYLLLSPATKGLFHRAISMSGTAFAPWASARDAWNQAGRLAWLFNCPLKPSKYVIECLKTKDAEKFVEYALMFQEWNIDPILVFSPSVEPPHKGLRLLPSHTMDLVKESERATLMDDSPVPWMVGHTFQDGAIRSSVLYPNVKLANELNDDWERIAPITLRYKESAGNVTWVNERIRWFYFDKDTILSAPVSQLTLMYTDRHFFHPMVESVQEMMKAGTKRSIYMYRVNHRGLHSITKVLDPYSDTDYGVCHFDDLQYIFYMPDYYPAVPKDKDHPDHKMMVLMTQLLVDFAKTGNPTPETEEGDPPKATKKNATDGEKEEVDFKWLEVKDGPPGTVQDMAELQISKKPFMTYTFMWSHRTNFWSELGLAENGRPHTTTTTTPTPKTTSEGLTEHPGGDDHPGDQIPPPPAKKEEL